MKIIVTKDLGMYPDQREQLEALGDVTYYDSESETEDEWLSRVKGADVICTGGFGFNSEKVYELHNAFISLPFVGVDQIDVERLAHQGVKIANAPGCNKESVAEWVIAMMLYRFRHLENVAIMDSLSSEDVLQTGISLWSKNIAIIGAGNIGQHLESILISFGAYTKMYRRGDNLHKIIADADITINCLRADDSTEGFLDRKFFESLKKGSYFISVARPMIYDIDAMLDALDSGRLAGAIDDAASAKVGDITDEIYIKLKSHPKIVTTPHIAWNAESEARKSNDIMISNIEAWQRGESQNQVN